jgi:hypothetical protein
MAESAESAAERHLEEIERFFASLASGEARERFGHIKYFDTRKPVLIVNNGDKP